MNQRLDRFLLTAVAGISLYWVSRFFDRGLSVVDEGFIASLSMRVLGGELPYRDFFTLITPGVFLLHAGLYDLFGPSLLVGRYVLLGIASTVPVLIYAIARRRLHPLPSLAAAALSLIWGPSALENINHANYNWLSHFFALIGLWLASIGIDLSIRTPSATTKKRLMGTAFLTGLSLGLAVLFKQNIGGYAFIALFVFFCWFEKGQQRLYVLAAICAGTFLANFPVLIWMGWNDSLEAMYRHILQIPMSDFAKDAALPYPDLWPVWPGFPHVNLQVSTVFLALIPFTYLALGLLWFKDRLNARARVPTTDQQRAAAFDALIVLYSGFAFLGNFPRPDYGHLVFNMSAGFITMMVLASRVHFFSETHFGRTAATVVMAFAALVLARPLFEQGIRNTLWTLGVRESLLNSPRAGIKVSVTAANALNEVLLKLQHIKASGEEVFITPHAPLLFFLADIPNPTRYEVLMLGNYESGTMQEVMDLLEKKRVAWVVVRNWPSDDQLMSDYAPEFTNFIHRNYQSVLKIETYEFFSLRPDQPSNSR
ncbi:MAG: hypothetical protein HEQ39_03700 [Rhizobacter sp.]